MDEDQEDVLDNGHKKVRETREFLHSGTGLRLIKCVTRSRKNTAKCWVGLLRSVPEDGEGNLERHSREAWRVGDEHCKHEQCVPKPPAGEDNLCLGMLHRGASTTHAQTWLAIPAMPSQH